MNSLTTVQLVGSVPLANAEEVFRTASRWLGKRLRRLPDGETGDRTQWIVWQFPILSRHPGLQMVPPQDNYSPQPRLRIRHPSAPLVLDSIGYAEVAKASYLRFAYLKEEGVIPQGCRFQVSLPTPLAVTQVFVVPPDHARFEQAYETRLLQELKEICAAIPSEELAIQWDVAVEIGMLEGVWKPDFELRPGLWERLARLGEGVPQGVELGFHLCYGDYGHEHFIQPKDMGYLVETANALCAGIWRLVDWIQMPVPRSRTDDAYFEPLRQRKLQPGTELILGLVHFTDGLEGGRRRMEVARRFVNHFGISTECGLGRRPRETIEPLLKLHAELADSAGR
jgi:hypothetical protein